MLSQIVAWAKRSLIASEDKLVGTVEKAMSPLTRIMDELKALEARASAAETKAREEVNTLLLHAGQQADKVYAARAKITKLEGLLK